MTQAHHLAAKSISLAYGDRPVIDVLNLDIAPGRITAIVGPNGCGKSTLLRALARLIKPTSGSVLLDGDPLHKQPSKQVARILGLLPQSPIAPEGIAVSDLVGRGRHPHQRPFTPWNSTDYAAVASALEATETTDLADRSVEELSGGQRQRVWIAMALAQQPEILLLDEPTTFLDLAHQIEILDLLADLNREHGTTIVMVLHDINMAARYADQLVALREGRLCAAGAPHNVVSADFIRELFGLDCSVIRDPVSGAPLVLPRGRHHVDAAAMPPRVAAFASGSGA